MTRRVYWPYAPHPGNFGDVLTSKILDHFGIAYQQVYENWDMICIGSIADHARPDRWRDPWPPAFGRKRDCAVCWRWRWT